MSIDSFIRCTLSRPWLQRFWERLHRAALSGMNCGGGDDIRTSGEMQVLRRVRQLVIPAGAVPTVFDVGANVGQYTLAVVNFFGDRVRLYCFEPSSATFARLANTLSKHKNVQLFNCGLGKEKSDMILYSDSLASGMASLYKRRLDHLQITMDHTEQVKIITIDEFAREKAEEHIHLLKLDVEGNELDVLAGAGRMIRAGAIDLIQFEFGGCNIDSRTYFQDFFYLLNTNYRLYRILPTGLAAVRAYKEQYEVFTTTNYVAMSRRLEG